jgi:phosphohistidine swiveling domain-containing protein
LQVRPLAAAPGADPVADEDVEEEVANAERFFAGLSRSAPGLAGERTVLGVMPDWNPAEMIGIAPRRLALSLYQRLIGAHAWARARARIGYRDVAPVSLIVALAGRPYVDVRASLSSLLPADVSEPTAHALVEAQLARLCERHDLHDKIEFEVALTCHALDFDARIVDYAAVGLPSAELDGFRRALVSLTDRMLLGRAPRIGDELGRLRTLEERRRQRCAFVPLEASQAARVAVEALDDCAERGVEPFAVLARYAFVAMALLRSLRARGVLSGAEYDALLRAIPTIGSRFSNDVEALRTRQVPATAFLDRYGHLRPSSYEITAPSYAEAPELYLSGGDAPQAEHSAAPSPDDARAIFDAHRVEIDRLLAEAGFEARTDALAGFVVAAIPAREHAKFEFMRTLDSALRALARWGELVGLTREEVSHLPIETIASTASESLSAAARSELSREAAYGRKRWALTRALALPPLITRSADLRRFVLHEARPNFVTSKRVTANVVYVEPGRAIPPLAGRIVVVESADPGYDWVFSHGIAALVTRYGGVASHMCIRAAEFGLPAAIGCGDVLFEQIARAAVVELDCASGTVRVVR